MAFSMGPMGPQEIAKLGCGMTERDSANRDWDSLTWPKAVDDKSANNVIIWVSSEGANLGWILGTATVESIYIVAAVGRLNGLELLLFEWVVQQLFANR